jgi:hypothetical protein
MRPPASRATRSTRGRATTSLGGDGAPGGGDDLAIDVDFTPIRREKTLERLRIVNQAIVLYNGVYQTTDPLPARYAQAYTKLVQNSFLPDSDEYLVDAWGETFVADPAGPPLVKVRSISLSPQNAESGGSSGSGGKKKGKKSEDD